MTVVYCEECGEYLGDTVKGVLYKFGNVVKEPHQCEATARENQEIAENMRDYWTHLSCGAER